MGSQKCECAHTVRGPPYGTQIPNRTEFVSATPVPFIGKKRQAEGAGWLKFYRLAVSSYMFYYVL